MVDYFKIVGLYYKFLKTLTSAIGVPVGTFIEGVVCYIQLSEGIIHTNMKKWGERVNLKYRRSKGNKWANSLCTITLY